MHVFIATPAYSGQVHVPYAISLAETHHLLLQHGVQVTFRLSVGSSLIAAERNRLLELFWSSGATHMLCIDGDLGWPPQAVLAMLEAKRDFVCGVYPTRDGSKSFLFRPKTDSNNCIVQDKHLLAMEYVPAGFMLLSRECVRKMREFHSNLFCVPKQNDRELPFYALFDTEVYEGEYWGEDYVFCRRARQAGVEIWCDPLIEFDHAGTRGALVQCLTPASQKEAA